MHVERAGQEVTPAFRKIFDEALVQAHEKLVAAPQDLAAKVRFVTIYHVILEATLGLTTFRFDGSKAQGAGVLRSNGSKKPAYCELAAARGAPTPAGCA